MEKEEQTFSMKNDLGVDPDDWFGDSKNNPLDSMPVATNRYHPDGEPPDWEDTAPCEYEPPRPEEEIADDWFIEEPDERDQIEKEKTMHQKMYEIATARYNPFSVGGSENCDSDISCHLGGGSEQVQL